MAKELKIRITGDSSGLKKGTDEAEGILSGFGSKVSAWSVATGTLIADGIKTGASAAIGFLGDSISQASDLNEAATKIDQLFGEAAGSINEFAAGAATELGQSKLAALDGAATFATFGKAAGLAGEDLVKFSADNVRMASDFASFFNTSPEDAIEKIGAAFRGESEPIREFGIMLDAASIKAKAISMGLVKAEVDTLKLSKAQEVVDKATRKANEAFEKYGNNSQEYADASRDLEQAGFGLEKVMEGQVGELSQGQKIMAAQALIMEQGAAAQGDFARTSGGLANQQRILSAQIDNLKGKIGTALLPVVQKIVSFANSKLIPAFGALADVWLPRISTAFKVLSSGFRNFADGRTTSGVFGFFEQVGIYAGQVVAWFQKLAGVFRDGGWQAALLEIGKKLVDVWLAAADWLYTSALPAIGRFLLEVGKKFGTWITETAVPYLQANLPIWLDVLVQWWNSTAAPWIGDKMLAAAKQLGEWVVQAATYLKDNLPGWLAAFADWYYTTALPWVGEKMGEIARKLGEWVVDAAVYLKDNLPGWIGAFVEWAVGTAIPELVKQTLEFQKKLADWVLDAAIDLAKNLPGWIAAFNRWTQNEALPAMIQFGKDLLTKMAEGTLGASTFLWDTGKEIVQGLINGLLSMGGQLKGAVEGLIRDNIPGPVRDILGIASPSKVFHEIGVQTAQGLAGGMLAGSGLVSAAAGRMAGAAIATPRIAGYSPADLAGGSQAPGGWQQVRHETVVQIDGRTIAVATSKPWEMEKRAAR